MSATRTDPAALARRRATAIVEACANRHPLLGLIELYGDARVDDERERLILAVERLRRVPFMRDYPATWDGTLAAVLTLLRTDTGEDLT